MYYAKENNLFVTKILRQHHSALFSYTVGRCRRLKIDEILADDFLQDFYLSILEAPNQLAVQGYESHGINYLLRMIRNAISSSGRRISRLHKIHQAIKAQLVEETAWPSTTDPLFMRELLEGIEAVLSGEELIVIRLFLDGYKYHEIAEKIFRSVPTVCRIKKRAIEKLAQYFNKMD